MLTSTNPATGLVLEQYPALQAEELNDRINQAADAWPGWNLARMNLRSKVMMAVAEKLRDQTQELAELMALEMGKPIRQGRREVAQAIECVEYFANQAAVYLGSEHVDTSPDSGSESPRDHYVTYQPIGPVLGVVDASEPVWQAFRFLAPTLMAGNTCVLKHAAQVQGTANLIVELIQQVCGRMKVPDARIVVNLPIADSEVAAAIRHPAIQGLSFAGSSPVGAQLAAVAASAIKRTVLQLSGSDACIVMADGDLEQAVDMALQSRMKNSGQSGLAVKRVLVEAPVYQQVIELLKQRMAKLQVGDPLLQDSDIGPIARQELLNTLQHQVTASIAAGAKCLLGGEPLARPGFYYPPTLLVDVQPGMPAFDEETFGPVLAVTCVDTFEQALAVANQTRYGLAASIWTRTPRNKRQAILNLQAGQVAINGMVKTDPRLPSGGIKQSGYGRELGPQGIREFTNAKQVWVG
ncbi:aldehyde dehydrogenase family protein [Oceanobacter mangrovi]|uniref:aldehyde dehydrogenase family protein n=1 Tax=Oceanobacter mangrovi TaxID=2862510 RepID=UPI001C8D075F|nr:aldehyde dehydrogenase family protein [Oceanobacter mangrovi]